MAHSMGSPTMLYFLNHQPQAWKDKYIRALVTISGVWGGALKTLRLMSSGKRIKWISSFKAQLFSFFLFLWLFVCLSLSLSIPVCVCLFPCTCVHFSLSFFPPVCAFFSFFPPMCIFLSICYFLSANVSQCILVLIHFYGGINCVYYIYLYHTGQVKNTLFVVTPPQFKLTYLIFFNLFYFSSLYHCRWQLGYICGKATSCPGIPTQCYLNGLADAIWQLLGSWWSTCQPTKTKLHS